MKILPRLTLDLVLPLMAIGMCQAQTGTSAPVQAHDPARAYDTWALCPDTSLSPAEEQFQKLLKVLAAIARKDIGANDLAWLVPIESHLQAVKLYAIPAQRTYKSGPGADGATIKQSQAMLAGVIRALKQADASTDLQTSLQAALRLLRSHPRSGRKTLVAGSDFITDKGSGRISMEPPEPGDRRAAEGVSVLLLVTRPKAEYLRKLRVSPDDLVANVEGKWGAYFKAMGAAAVTVQMVDAAAATAIGSDGAEALK